METVTVLFKEEPESKTFRKGGINVLSVDEAFKYIDQGYAVGYNKEYKEEYDPFLSEEYPNRKILFENGIYTEETLSKCISYAASLDGIGSKSIQAYKENLGLVEE